MKPHMPGHPAEITSYDFLKTFAVITMVIDHIGYFFFPDVLEWRAVGRMSLPVWMFLIGYANTRDIPKVVWIGALFLLGGYFIAGHPVMALNILFTVAVVRAVLDTVMRLALGNREYFSLTMISLFFLVLPTVFLFEYGTLAVMWAMAGYVCRHRVEIGWGNKLVIAFFVLVSLIYVVYQATFFQFAIENTMIMIACVATSAYFLYNFKPEVYQLWTEKLPPITTSILKFTGRMTLQIYVAHILIFLVIAIFMGDERFGFFDFKIYP